VCSSDLAERSADRAGYAEGGSMTRIKVLAWCGLLALGAYSGCHKSKTEQAKDDVSSGAEKADEAVDESAEHAKDKTKKAANDVDEAVEEAHEKK